MITSRWSESLDGEVADEARALVEAAAEYDAESGFASIDPALVGRRMPDEREARHLIVWSSPDGDLSEDAPQLLAAYGRTAARERDPDTLMQFVVHPDFRSRGVATLLMENVAVSGPCAAASPDPPGSRRIRWWAYGDHPAADRLARRFAIGVFERRWTMLRYMRLPAEVIELRPGIELGSYDGADAERVLRGLPEHVTGGGRLEAALEAVQLDPTARTHVLTSGGSPVGFSVSATGRPRSTSVGSVSRISAISAVPIDSRDVDPYRILLAAALGDVSEVGAAYAELRLDPGDDALLDACRLAGFEPEQADVGYELEVSGS